MAAHVNPFVPHESFVHQLANYFGRIFGAMQEFQMTTTTLAVVLVVFILIGIAAIFLPRLEMDENTKIATEKLQPRATTGKKNQMHFKSGSRRENRNENEESLPIGIA